MSHDVYFNPLSHTYDVCAHDPAGPTPLLTGVSNDEHIHPTGVTGIALAQNGNNIIAENKPPFRFGKKWETKNAEIWDFYKNKNRHYKRWFRFSATLIAFILYFLVVSVNHNCVWGKKHPANAGCFTLLVQSRLILFVHRVLTWIPMFRDRQQFP